jgi:hypothetical protein
MQRRLFIRRRLGALGIVLMKGAHNLGYENFLILFPASGQGMVVMTTSDHGGDLAEALIRRGGGRLSLARARRICRVKRALLWFLSQ